MDGVVLKAGSIKIDRYGGRYAASDGEFIDNGRFDRLWVLASRRELCLKI